MKIYVFLFLFISFDFSYSQNHQIFDVITKKPVPYVAVQLSENNSFYSNELGFFNLSKNVQDSILLACLGYENLFLSTNNLRDSIYLIPKTQKLDKIIIHAKKPKIKTIGRKGNSITWHINRNIQLASLIQPSEKYINSYVQKIYLPISKSTLINREDRPKKIKPNFNSVFKVHLFSNENNLPGKALLAEPITVYCNQDSKKSMVVNLSEAPLKFPEDGFFICIEMIGETDENGNILDKKNPLPGFEFTKKNTKHFTSKFFYKSKFSNKWQVMTPEKFPFPKEIFLAIQLEVALYE